MARTRRFSTLITTIVATVALVGCGDSANPPMAEAIATQAESTRPTLYDPLEAEVDIRTDPNVPRSSSVTPSSTVYAVLMIEMRDRGAKFEADVDVSFGIVGESGKPTPLEEKKTRVSIDNTGEVIVEFGPTFAEGVYFVMFEAYPTMDGFNRASYSVSFSVDESSRSTSTSPAPDLFEPWLQDAELAADTEGDNGPSAPYSSTDKVAVVAVVETRKPTDSVPVRIKVTWTAEADRKIVGEDEVTGHASGQDQWTFEAGPFPPGSYHISVQVESETDSAGTGLAFTVE